MKTFTNMYSVDMCVKAHSSQHEWLPSGHDLSLLLETGRDLLWAAQFTHLCTVNPQCTPGSGCYLCATQGVTAHGERISQGLWSGTIASGCLL